MGMKVGVAGEQEGALRLASYHDGLTSPANSKSTSNRTARLHFQPLHRIAILSVVLAYAAILLYILQVSISKAFQYEGYAFEPITNSTHLIWTWSLLILVGCFLPIRLNKPSSFFVWLIFLVVYVPANLMPTYALGYGLEYAAFQGILFAGMALLTGVGLLPPFRLPEPKWSFRVFIAGLLIYSLLMMTWLVLRVGVPTSIPSFANVYVQRTAYGAAIAGAGPIVYLIAWQTSVVNPLLILTGLFTRRWTLTATGIGLNVLMYALAGHKSHLLSSVLVIAVAVLLQLKDSARGMLVACGAIALMVISQALYAFGGAIYPISIFVRRMIMVPGVLTGYYFDFFSETGNTYRFGPMAIFFQGAELEATTPRTIGFEYFGSETMAANANFWADSFSALGYPGMVVASILLALVLWTMDSLNNSRPTLIAIPLFVVALYSLTNSALPTSLLTHGILVAMLAVWMMPLSAHSHRTRSTKPEVYFDGSHKPLPQRTGNE